MVKIPDTPLAPVSGIVFEQSDPLLSRRRLPDPGHKKTAGPKPRRRDRLNASLKSTQQLENALVRLVGERERGDRDRLAGRQRLAVGRFLVGIGQSQVG